MPTTPRTQLAARLALGIVASATLAATADAQSYNSRETYADPAPETTALYRGSGAVCSDPWVTIALIRVKGSSFSGFGNSGDCDVAQYNGGSWNGSFNTLVHAVAETHARMGAAGVAWELRRIDPKTVAAVLVDANGIVAAGSGNIVAAGSGNIVAAGAGNLVGNNGNTFTEIAPNQLVAAKGARLIGADGGTFKSLPSAAVTDGSRRSVMSAKRTVRLPAGRVLVVK